MNTVLGRLNAVFAFTLSVLAFTTLLCFFSTLFNDNLTAVEIVADKVSVRKMPDFTTQTRTKKDLASIANMKLKVDLTDVFNWNVKEIFLYLTAEYTSERHAVNQVVLWDRIVMREDNQVLDLSSVRPKYYFFDEGNGILGNKNVTLTLSWNVIPNAGNLPRVTGIGSTIVEFPATYTESNSRF